MQDGHRIELVRHRPSMALDGLVAGIVGFSERASGVVRRSQPAGTLLPLVFSFGRPLTISLAEGTGVSRSYGSFVAGLSTGSASTRFEGGQDCVQVYLTPVGVRRILGVPGREVARQVVVPGDLVPGMGDNLVDRLHSMATWGERFQLVEARLIQQLARETECLPWVTWMWQAIHQTGGRARIGDLVTSTGWSHRYATTVFAEQIGLRPKQAAAVVRFECAAADLGRLPLAEIAARHGYADQSHLARDVARYAGETPSELAAARRPTPSTALGLVGDRVAVGRSAPRSGT